MGQPLEIGAPHDLLALPAKQCPEVSFQAWDTSVKGITKLLEAKQQRVIEVAELADLNAWAPAGEITTVIADHELMPAELFAANLPPHQWGAGIGLLTAWAGWDYARALALFTLPKNEFTQAVRDLIITVRKNLRGRRLQVLGLSERPLLGADSVLTMTPAAFPINTLASEDLVRLTLFFQAAKDFLLSESILEPVSPVERDWNPARADGSGVGFGVGALPQLVQGFRGRALEAFAFSARLETQVTSETLMVAVVPQLHPQTVATSVLGILKDLTAASGAALIVFTEEASLSKHELFEWNVTACYGGQRKPLTVEDAARILTQTWLRPR
ncbi:hypothetical protein NXS08_02995 [Gleimia sp. 6138-11-ORH1]|uniref:hypothetical protein n=1 Tax=Gleimia sp. 6138-11-ORH1 TaxID=2973937 RepID=UPI0021699ED8|nr:hypothetical protein [Gleimia sp. 6138-11-ORH1]MCS4484455.1 hypothetical protein [Gleimia sp. 6138-11-ORH1]